MTQTLTSHSQPVNYLSCKHTWSRADAGLQPAPLKCIIDLKQMWDVYHRGPWKPGLSWLEIIQTVTFEVYCTHDMHVQQKQQTRALLHHLKVQPWMITHNQPHFSHRSGEASPLILSPTSASSFAMWASQPQNRAPSHIVHTRTNIASVNRSCCFQAAFKKVRTFLQLRWSDRWWQLPEPGWHAAPLMAWWIICFVAALILEYKVKGSLSSLRPKYAPAAGVGIASLWGLLSYLTTFYHLRSQPPQIDDFPVNIHFAAGWLL